MGLNLYDSSVLPTVLFIVEAEEEVSGGSEKLSLTSKAVNRSRNILPFPKEVSFIASML